MSFRAVQTRTICVRGHFLAGGVLMQWGFVSSGGNSSADASRAVRPRTFPRAGFVCRFSSALGLLTFSQRKALMIKFCWPSRISLGWRLEELARGAYA